MAELDFQSASLEIQKRPENCETRIKNLLSTTIFIRIQNSYA